MSRKIINIAVISVAAVGIAFGLRYWIRNTWSCTILKTQTLADKVKISDLQFESGSHSFTAMVIRLPHETYKAHLIEIAPGETLASRLATNGVVINAGYFDDANNPVGLLRIDGQDRNSLVDQQSLSGIVMIDSKGAIRLLPRALVDSIKESKDAFQAGPFLIDPGGAIGMHSDDGTSAERTVLVYDRSCVEIVITSPVTLYELANCLKQNASDFDLYAIDCALNLDGGPSTSYAIHVAGKSSGFEPRKPIRNAIRIDLR